MDIVEGGVRLISSGVEGIYVRHVDGAYVLVHVDDLSIGEDDRRFPDIETAKMYAMIWAPFGDAGVLA